MGLQELFKKKVPIKVIKKELEETTTVGQAIKEAGLGPDDYYLQFVPRNSKIHVSLDVHHPVFKNPEERKAIFNKLKNFDVNNEFEFSLV